MARGVWRGYGPRWVLRDVNFEVAPGKRLVVFGPNGSGKSTLIRVLATLLRPHAGSVSIEGADVHAHGDFARSSIGVVAHQPYLYEDLTAVENLWLFGQLYGVPNLGQRVQQQLEIFHLADHGKGLVRTFSRGMQQRLALARALLHSPRVLLLDEPDTGLDLESIGELEVLLRKPPLDENTVVMATHDLELGLRWADQVAILHHGTFVFQASAGDLTPETLKQAYQKATGEAAPSVTRARPSTSPSAEAPLAPPVSRVASAGLFLTQGIAILRKDLVQELRTREAVTGTIIFALLALLVFQFAFAPTPEMAPSWGAGALWASFIFGGMLGFGRAFAGERDKGTLEGLLLAPFDRSALYLAKLAANYCLMLALAVVALPVFGAMFNLPVFQPAVLSTVALGTFALAVVGTLFSAVTANVRTRELMLPTLLLPLAVPVVISASSATADALGSPGSLNSLPWLGLLAAFSGIVFAVALVLFEHIVEE